VTTTDEILALAASAASNARANPEAIASAVDVTDADMAAFSQAAARGAGSAVVRALLAARPAAEPGAPPSATPLGDPAWNAWLAAAAAATSDATWTPELKAGPIRPAWSAIFAVGAALAGPSENLRAGVTVPVAVATGMRAAAVIESGLAEWGGWSSGTIAATIGSTVTASLLLGLTQPQLRAALGISATQAAGLLAAEGTSAYALQIGKAAFNGAEAALLARSGLTAPDEPLDGRRGLFALFG
jgi:2-methylcitrate dehydratase PrpD